MTDIFDGGTPPATPPVEPTPPVEKPEDNPLLTKLMEIKNEKGEPKYDSLEKAIEALSASQSYIPTLKTELEAKEAELAELKAKQESSESVEQIVEKLLQKNQTPAEPITTGEPKGLDEESVAAIVRKEQERLAKQAEVDANASKVTKILTEKYGDKTKEEVAKKAVELGMTVEKLGELAMEAPDAVLRLFTIGDIKSPAPSSSDVNTFSFLKAPDTELEKPSKSLLSGASSKDQAAYMKQIKDEVYKKHGVTT